jgi:stage V sporulation protein G
VSSIVKGGNMVKLVVTRIHKLDGAGLTKAFVDIAVEDCMVINGLRVVEGKDGLFVSMPKEVGKDGRWYNIVIPLTREFKDELEKLVLEAYDDSAMPLCFGELYSTRNAKCVDCAHKKTCRAKFLKKK